MTLAERHAVPSRTLTPFAPARERKRRSFIDRRQSLRLIVVDWLYCVESRALTLDAPIVLKDLSLGGFAFESALVLPKGTEHRFQFTAQDGSSFEVTAESVHSAPVDGADGTRYLTGMKFLRSPEQEQNDPIKVLVDKIHRALTF